MSLIFLVKLKSFVKPKDFSEILVFSFDFTRSQKILTKTNFNFHKAGLDNIKQSEKANKIAKCKTHNFFQSVKKSVLNIKNICTLKCMWILNYFVIVLCHSKVQMFTLLDWAFKIHRCSFNCFTPISTNSPCHMWSHGAHVWLKKNKQNNNKKKLLKGVNENKNVAFQLWIFFILAMNILLVLYAGSKCQKQLKTGSFQQVLKIMTLLQHVSFLTGS